MANIESVVRFRLLGSHPAASGRYYTLSFPGEVTVLGKILDDVVQEHSINMSRYRLEVKKLLPGGEQQLVVLPSTQLRTYDCLDIIIVQRQLGDENLATTAQQHADELRRTEELEHQVSVAVAGGILPGGGGALAGSGGMQMMSGGRSGVASSSSGVEDPLRMQRVAAVANLIFPIRRGEHSDLTGIGDPQNDHICVLCNLGAYQEELTSCCMFPVCAACRRSAADMTHTEGECPVCGEDAIERSHNDMEKLKSQSRKQEDKCFAAHGFSITKKEGAAGDGMKRPRSELSSTHARSFTTVSTASSSLPSHAATASTPTDTSAIAAASSCSGRKDADMERYEKQLRGRMVHTLALLDVPDPLSPHAKAARVKSGELAAMDELLIG